MSSTTEQRFWMYVRRGDLCWLWQGPIAPNGYGRFNADYQGHHAHRYAYELLVGPIPEGMQIDHLCRNRACVNPEHLEVVTPAENQRRGFSPTGINGRKTRCIHGHSLEGDNLWIDSRGRRCCKECRRRVNREWQSRQPKKGPAHLRGELAGSSKLTEPQVLEIRRRYDDGGVTLSALAKEYGVGVSQVHRIVRRETWAHV